MFNHNNNINITNTNKNNKNDKNNKNNTLLIMHYCALLQMPDYISLTYYLFSIYFSGMIKI